MERSSEEITAMAQRLLDGDRGMVEPLIEAHIKLVYQVSKIYRKRNSSRQDGILSAGFYGLVKAVNWAAEGRLKDTGISKYIRVTVSRFIQEFLEHDHTIRIPRKAFKKQASTGTFLKMIPILEDTDRTFCLYAKDCRALSFDDLNLTATENVVLERRIAGMTQQEIGDELDCSQSFISLAIQSIKKKYAKVRMKK